ncbi:hypothetical protein BZL29_6174 [Mycobacterium kansasii]|uniref:Uncharacterized protein n=1 Tax=Mycobacterium kansasii TaxID=1768 RepID=A0A1V3WRZ6_MYCKA|nr:hypothetical protein BZL29_6174 [Mycobacterium kansasii]
MIFVNCSRRVTLAAVVGAVAVVFAPAAVADPNSRHIRKANRPLMNRFSNTMCS